MAFTLSNLLQNFYTDTGQVDPKFGMFLATGGSATTFVNSLFANLESPPEIDELVNKLCIVSKDSAGAGASPEGKYGVITDYAESTWTGTIPTVTDAIAAGDSIMIAHQDKFPYLAVEFQANRALAELGDIPLVDTSLTSSGNKTEYAVPVGLKRRPPRAVYYQTYTGDSDDNQWREIQFRFEPAAPGATGLLYLPQLPADRTIRIIYDGVHPTLTAYSSVISETIHPPLITAMTILKTLEGYNRQTENQASDSYFLYLENLYRDRILPQLMVEFPIWKPPGKVKTFRMGGRVKVDRPPQPFI